MVNKRPRRSRAARLLMPFVVLGIIAAIMGGLHVASLLAGAVCVFTFLVLLRNGYGPRL